MRACHAPSPQQFALAAHPVAARGARRSLRDRPVPARRAIRLAPPELKKIHPLGKSPVIKDAGKTVAESGAIIEYLVEQLRQRAAAAGPDRRPRTVRRNGCTSPKARRCCRCCWRSTSAGSARPAAAGAAHRQRDREPHGLHGCRARDRRFVVGNDLTGADIQLSSPRGRGLAARPFPASRLPRTHARATGYQRGIEKGGPYQLIRPGSHDQFPPLASLIGRSRPDTRTGGVTLRRASRRRSPPSSASATSYAAP